MDRVSATIAVLVLPTNLLYTGARRVAPHGEKTGSTSAHDTTDELPQSHQTGSGPTASAQRDLGLHVQDCIDAILTAIDHPQAQAKINIFNLGSDEYCTVDESLGWICQRLGLNPIRHYTGGERGWVGDSPFIFLDCNRIRSLGWRPRLTIRQSVECTLDYLMKNKRLFDRRR